MKTLTEFSGAAVRRGLQERAKLQAEGTAAEQLIEKLGERLDMSGDRLARLAEALDLVGDKPERVRLVRVFAGEHEPKGAKKVGEFNYVIDLQPDPAAARPTKDPRARGGDRGGGGGGGGGGRARGVPGGAGGGKAGGGWAGIPREDRSAGPTPSAGEGWTLTRAQPAPGERRDRGGPRKGRDGRGGPRPPGQRDASRPAGQGPGAKEGAPGAPRGPRGPGGGGGGGDRRRGEGGRGRPPGPAVEVRRPRGTPPDVAGGAVTGEAAAAPGAPGAPGAARRRRRRGRGGSGGQPHAPASAETGNAPAPLTAADAPGETQAAPPSAPAASEPTPGDETS